MRDKAADALLGAAIKTVEELEGLVAMLENVNTDEGPKLTSKIREIADLLDRLPLLANDLMTIKRRLRGMLSSDPEKTPRAVSVRDFVAVNPEEETRLEPVEDRERRIQTRPGLGIPLPKKTPP
jgi:hypothetical protein